NYLKEVLSDTLAVNVFGTQLEVPETNYAEGKGHRLMVSYLDKKKENHFVTVFQMVDGEKSPLPLIHERNEVGNVVYIGEHVIVVTPQQQQIEEPFSFTVKNEDTTKVVLTGLKEGRWKVLKRDALIEDVKIKREENAFYFEADPGRYLIVPD